ncbi:TIGR04086 family membrane protein [Paenibacillus sp. 1P07SE]|uniref:TIGR04086 family membrane protein n=1 Tax=Paenibacillus sp. 1P07SE TaxID=3132209 RepID=UPI0039A679D0
MMNPIKHVPKVKIGSPLLAGLMIAAIWLAASVLLLSLLLHFSSMKEQSLPQLSLIVHGICALAGGFVAGRRSGQKGWYHGSLLGGFYGLLVLLAGFLALDAPLSLQSLMLFALALAAGGIGGMVGIHARSQ